MLRSGQGGGGPPPPPPPLTVSLTVKYPFFFLTASLISVPKRKFSRYMTKSISLPLRKLIGCWDFGEMTIKNLNMGGITKKSESVGQGESQMSSSDHGRLDCQGELPILEIPKMIFFYLDISS